MSSCSHNSSAQRQQNDIPPAKSQKPTTSSWYLLKHLFLGLLLEVRETVDESLAMLVRGMLGKSWGSSGLQECRLADLTLDILCLLVDFELRLGDFGIFVLAIALGGCLCTVSHFDGCSGRLRECVLGVRFA